LKKGTEALEEVWRLNLLYGVELIVQLMPFTFIIDVDNLDSDKQPRRLQQGLPDYASIARADVFDVLDVVGSYKVVSLSGLVVGDALVVDSHVDPFLVLLNDHCILINLAAV